MSGTVQEIAKAGRGLLLSGKHDQLGRSVPYAALAQLPQLPSQTVGIVLRKVVRVGKPCRLLPFVVGFGPVKVHKVHGLSREPKVVSSETLV